MKKIMTLMSLMLMILTIGLTDVLAEDDQDFPYEGLYVTPEDRAVQGYLFEDGRMFLIYDRTNFSDRRNAYRIIDLWNLSPSQLELLDPSISAEEIEALRKELGLDESVRDRIIKVAHSLPDNATYEEFERLMDSQYQQIEIGCNIGNLHVDYIKLAQPTINQRGDEWVIRVFQKRLFSVKDGEESGTIEDDFQGVYYKVDDISEIGLIINGDN